MTTYKMICRICGREFDKQADFFSVGVVAYHNDRLVGTCNMEHGHEHDHTGDEIRATFANPKSWAWNKEAAK
jgi:hypothetical protein